MVRLVVAMVVNDNGDRVPGADVLVTHVPSGRVVYQGQSKGDGKIQGSETYDPDEGGYLEFTAAYPGAIGWQGRMVQKTVVADAVSAAYQCVILKPYPRKRFARGG